jgi:hypothetical protein
MKWVALGIFALVACGHPRNTNTADALADALDDASGDTALDTGIDVAIDVPMSVDAVADVPASTSPACTTAPTILLDVSPRRIGNLAFAGNVLYVSAYQVDGQSNVTNAVVLAIDPITGAEVAAPLAMAGAPLVWSAGDVYASDLGAGTIWRLHPGDAPVAVVTGRLSPMAVTTDGAYLYWSEKNQTFGMKDLVQRRLIAGGPVELVMTCDGARSLIVVGDELYCAAFVDGVLHGPKVGPGTDTPASIPFDGYPLSSMTLDGNVLYLVNAFNNPRLFRIPLPTGPAVLVDELPILGRYSGLAMSSDTFYTIEQDSGLRRIDRATLAHHLIPDTTFSNGVPALWNNQLFFERSTPTSSGQPLVLHCVD